MPKQCRFSLESCQSTSCTQRGLTDSNFQRRLDSCNWCLIQRDRDENFLNNVLGTDEVQFDKGTGVNFTQPGLAARAHAPMAMVHKTVAWNFPQPPHHWAILFRRKHDRKRSQTSSQRRANTTFVLSCCVFSSPWPPTFFFGGT